MTFRLPPDLEESVLLAPKKPLTSLEFDRHLLDIGFISKLPDLDADFDDPNDEPIVIEGEPLSETVMRERR